MKRYQCKEHQIAKHVEPDKSWPVSVKGAFKNNKQWICYSNIDSSYYREPMGKTVRTNEEIQNHCMIISQKRKDDYNNNN